MNFFTDFSLRKLHLALTAPLRRMAESEPGPGRLAPQPNEDLRATHVVRCILGMNSRHG
jgi:hypothetical protein